jgi:hypothetical protein
MRRCRSANTDNDVEPKAVISKGAGGVEREVASTGEEGEVGSEGKGKDGTGAVVAAGTVATEVLAGGEDRMALLLNEDGKGGGGGGRVLRKLAPPMFMDVESCVLVLLFHDDFMGSGGGSGNDETD